MTVRHRLAAILALMASGAVGSFAAEPVIVILHPDANNWSVVSAARVLINGKNKIRLAGAGQTEVSSDEVKRSTELLVGSSTLRIHHSGYLLARSGSGWVTAFPEGANVKTSSSAAALWSGARLQIQTGGSKEPEVGSSAIFAILPGESASDSVAAFLGDESNFKNVGEKSDDAAFDERMSLLVAVAKSPAGTSPQLKTMLLSAMNQGIQKSRGGAVKYSDIQKALRFVTVSEKAFPSDPAQQQARDQLRERKAWIDRRVAILRALDAGQQYDPLIDKYSDFEFYDSEFPEVRNLRVQALQKSSQSHLEKAHSFSREKQNALAIRELKIALLRNPGDPAVEEEMETLRISEAHAHAALVKKKHPDPASPEQVRLMKHVHYAESAIADKHPDEATKEIEAAARIDPDSPRVLLTRAKLFESISQFAQALEVLDQYDGVVAAEESQVGFELRDQIETEIKRGKNKYRAEVVPALKSGDFVQARLLAVKAVEVAPKEAAFLYDAGVFSAITRHEREAQEYFRAYLAASVGLISETKRRADVIGWLPTIESVLKETNTPGPANWFSGFPSPQGLFYCPISLAPNARPIEVRSSHKQTTIFEWSGKRIMSVNTVTAPPGLGDGTVYFDYFGGGQGVKRLSTKPLTPEKQGVATRFTSEGVAGPGDGIYTGLYNNPDVNPYLAEKLTQQNVGVIISGNPYFHPFVWDGVHVFLAEYDSDGRVQSAHEIHAQGTPHTFTFQWEGARLMAITETGSPEGYKRTMQYTGDRINGELVHFRGRDSRIEYKYNGDRLAEAVCESDASLDNRSRHVTFRE